MKPENLIAAARLALNSRSAAWALHPRTLSMLAAIARGEVRVDSIPEELQARSDELQPEAARGESGTTGGVAVLPLRGLITARPSFLSLLLGGGGGLMGFRASLREAVASDEITAIVLNVDSPGGTTDLLAETAADLRQARQVKPVVAVANTWAASAAYWLAAQADELVVTPTGEVGSIGVFMVHEDWSAFNEKFGVDPTYISAGKYKTEGNPDEPLSDEARAAMQATIDAYYAMFVADVAAGRRVSATTVRDGYGEGRMEVAKQALALGMADRIDTLEATIARLVRDPKSVRRADAGEKNLDAGNPPLNSTTEANEASTVDEDAAARTRAKAVDLLTAPAPSF